VPPQVYGPPLDVPELGTLEAGGELPLDGDGLLCWLVSSSATHVHWPTQTGLLGELLGGGGGGELLGGELGTLERLESLGGGLLDGGGLDDGELDGDDPEDGGLEDGELDDGLLDGEDDGTLELLLDPQLQTSAQDVPAAAMLQSWPCRNTSVTNDWQTLLPERYSTPLPRVIEPV